MKLNPEEKCFNQVKASSSDRQLEGASFSFCFVSSQSLTVKGEVIVSSQQCVFVGQIFGDSCCIKTGVPVGACQRQFEP